jgi:hypothetical protein
MTDFLTRVAQRALGQGPAIQPLAVSRYAPARLPISEGPESEPISKPSAEADRRNVEGRPNFRSASLMSNPGRQPVAEQSWDDQPLRNDADSLSGHAESIGPTPGNEIQQPRPLTEFEAAAPYNATSPFEAEPPHVNANITTPATKAEAPSLLVSNRSPSEQQATLSLQDSTSYSAAEESSIVDEGLVNVEETGEPRRRLLREGPPLQNSTGYSSAEESSIDDEGQVNVEEAREPRRRVLREGRALQNSTGFSAAEESSIDDEGQVNVEEAGEPRRRVLREGRALQNSIGFSAAEESSIDDEGQVNVEEAGEPRRRVLREGPALQDSTGYSAVEGSSIVEEVMLTAESVETSHRVLSGGSRRTTDNRPDDLTASPGLYQAEHDNPSNTSHHSRQIPDTSDQVDRIPQIDESEDFAPEGELRSWSTPGMSRREIDSITEVFAQKPVSSLPSPRDERPKSGPPVIHVTVGRVEVRAVTLPLPAVEPQSPPAPKLSLDEFLRQHNGRRQ